MKESISLNVLEPIIDHTRIYGDNRFVYPVLSRRSKGISVGINLNPDKVCNFDCIYCEVDRRSEAVTTFVETDRLMIELETMLDYVLSGGLYLEPKFAVVPEALRRLNDIAFSGDGEPTTFKNIDAIVGRVADLKRSRGLHDVKLVMITNATMFHRPVVQKALAIMDENQGEIWAKLDAGTDAYYHLIERTTIPFGRVLENLLIAARVRPIVIQSLFMKVNGEGPSSTEIEAYCDRLREIIAAGGAIRSVQVYTVARKPAEAIVEPLADADIEAIACKVRESTGLAVESFVGASISSVREDILID